MQTHVHEPVSLEKRIERLESRNRQLLIVCAVLAGVVMWSAAGALGGVKDVVTARRFVLVDRAGQQRGSWSETGGEVTLELVGTGAARATILAGKENAGAAFASPEFYPSAYVGAGPSGAYQLLFGPVGSVAPADGIDPRVQAAFDRGVKNVAYLGASGDARLIVESKDLRRVDLWSGRDGTSEGALLTMESYLEQRKLQLGQASGAPYRLAITEQGQLVYEVPTPPAATKPRPW